MNATQVFADGNVGRVSLHEARAAMLAAAAPLSVEEIFLAAAHNRTLEVEVLDWDRVGFVSISV